MNKNPSKEPNETTDEWINRLIALENEEAAIEQERIESVRRNSIKRIKKLEKKIDAIGDAMTNKSRKAKKELSRQALMVITGIYIAS